MLIPFVNIALGLALVIGGATGRLLPGSTSVAVPIAIGAAISVYGVIQVIREVKRTRQ